MVVAFTTKKNQSSWFLGVRVTSVSRCTSLAAVAAVCKLRALRLREINLSAILILDRADSFQFIYDCCIVEIIVFFVNASPNYWLLCPCVVYFATMEYRKNMEYRHGSEKYNKRPILRICNSFLYLQFFIRIIELKSIILLRKKI